MTEKARIQRSADIKAVRAISAKCRKCADVHQITLPRAKVEMCRECSLNINLSLPHACDTYVSAITAFCKACIWEEGIPEEERNIEHCTIRNCPFWPYSQDN